MSSQDCNPTAASVATASEGAKPSRGTARSLMGKRLQQEPMTLIMSENPTLIDHCQALEKPHSL
uniref:Uncharacterized protein n=1 Tax=Rhinolophus ferrumequinum TaxID=59479 RepID=A0A671DSS4_RHIFE